MSTVTQDGRPLKIFTPFGANKVIATAVTAAEAISNPFVYEVSLLSEDAGLAPATILRKPVYLTLDLKDGTKRIFHGRVTRFAQAGKRHSFHAYQATIRPWFWLLSLWHDCRIFQKKTVPEIVEQIFKDRGFTDYKLKLYKSDYPKRDYCVQYRESCMDFVSRLLEEEGIFYFFEHTDTKHTLVLTDMPAGISSCPGQASARVAEEDDVALEEDVITGLERDQFTVVSEVTLNDFNFEKPNNDFKVQVGDEDQGEIYDFPGGYEERPGGERIARIRLEEQEARQITVKGSSNCRAFTAGYKFELKEHYRRDLNVPYLLTSLNITIHNAGLEAGQEAECDYSNSFEAIPAATPYRPPCVTPAPIVNGTQSAVVVGPKGEDIHTDKYGRVKVQFPWDRKGKKNEESSCWIRVSQAWAGGGWGALNIPRIGQEVLVDFLEGDPDRPIITGRVYNGAQMPVYSLPAEQHSSGIRSRSLSGGGSDNHSEIKMVDTKGAEIMAFHAEKDFHVETENDEIHSVGNDRTSTIEKDESKIIKKGNQDVKIKMGNQSTKVDLGKITTEAMQSIELICGQSSIRLDPKGVTIKGLMIQIEAQILLAEKGKVIQIKSDGPLLESGAIVLIN